MKNLLFTLMIVLVVSVCPMSVFATTANDTFQKEDLDRQRIIDEKPVYLEGDVDRSALTRTESDGIAATGTYPKTKGIILYTKDTVNKIAEVVGHAAIVYSDSQVVEATSKVG